MKKTSNSNNYLLKQDFVSSSESPCTSTCELDQASVYCVKCGRSTQQIQDWSIYTHDQKKEIVKQLKQKRKENGLG